MSQNVSDPILDEDIDRIAEDDQFFDDFWNGDTHDIPMVELDGIETAGSAAAGTPEAGKRKAATTLPPKKGKRPPLHPKRKPVQEEQPLVNPVTGYLRLMTLPNGPLTMYLQEMRALHATLSDNMNVVKSLVDSMFKVTSHCNTQQDFDALKRSLEMIDAMSNNVVGRTTKLGSIALSAKLEIQTMILLNSVSPLLTKESDKTSPLVKTSSSPVFLRRTSRPSTSELGASIDKHFESSANSLPVGTASNNQPSRKRQLYGSMAQQRPEKRPKHTQTLSVSMVERDIMFSPLPTTRTPGLMAFNRPTKASSSKN